MRVKRFLSFFVVSFFKKRIKIEIKWINRQREGEKWPTFERHPQACPEAQIL